MSTRSSLHSECCVTFCPMQALYTSGNSNAYSATLYMKQSQHLAPSARLEIWGWGRGALIMMLGLLGVALRKHH